MKKSTCTCLLALPLLLGACGIGFRTEAKYAVEPTPVPEATATPEPLPTPKALQSTEGRKEVTLSGENAKEILDLAYEKSLEHIDAKGSTEYDALRVLQEMLPNCEIVWTYPLGGEEIDSEQTEITLNSTEGLMEGLRYLPKLQKVDLTGCSVPNEEKDELLAAYPDVDFVWMVTFGNGNWTVRSDIEVFSTLFATGHSRYNSSELAPLFKYCRHLKALDVGHGNLTDISDIANLKELQALILSDNPMIRDISPLGELKNLTYLEIFGLSNVTDFSVLYDMPQMQQLNISYARFLPNLNFIPSMPNLTHLWTRTETMDTQLIRNAQAQYPDIEIFYYCGNGNSSTCCGWRATDYNVALRTAFANYPYVVHYNNWDDVEFQEGAPLKEMVKRYEHYFVTPDGEAFYE